MNRKQAELEYSKALKAARASEDQPDIEVFEAAQSALAIARTNLVAAEIANPTAAEYKKQSNLLYLRNRGLDV